MKRSHACCSSHATSCVASRISLRLLWALADISYCSSRFTVRVSFLPHSDLCLSSEMTSLPHGCIFFHMMSHMIQGKTILTLKIYCHFSYMTVCLNIMGQKWWQDYGKSGTRELGSCDFFNCISSELWCWRKIFLSVHGWSNKKQFSLQWVTYYNRLVSEFDFVSHDSEIRAKFRT